ncbi:isoaspartyl peptidase/L-asparaginase family protein [Pelagerythrobacter marensis]|uniref:Isoaspartyl peptidase n=1 Tax=Pelagerythrobacter marensis TaxID=543877 RepID=A0A0G3XDQ2_9SPHN|nr:isoaspartyl peptidase/L-asparaginase [Pelagerythrobacter marensis]AKM08724.1 Asparaginase [Pelagerythrobacter marensis]
MSKPIAALLAIFALFPLALSAQPAPEETEPVRWSLAIHGGAGTLKRENMTSEQEEAYRCSLQAALDAGAEVLASGGDALQAVEAAIVLLEDDPLFNAGRGSVFTWEGANEMDASIMDGRTRAAGAVAGVTTVRHPIHLARAVMDDGRHVFLSGAGAEQFATAKGLERMPPAWFATERRRKQLEVMKSRQLSALDVEYKFGTVGAVARDQAGHLAAGTSTGGMTGKRWGRIGDAPVIGAGTWADDRSCAVSATGWGEFFIRAGVAQAICDRVRLAGEGVQQASDTVIAEVAEMGGDGGVIVMSNAGEAVFSFNSAGMYRGRADSSGTNEVAIFAQD